MGAAEKLGIQKLTLEEYFELERTSENRHDYFEGDLVNLARASKAHNRILRKITVALDSKLRDQGCEMHIEGVMTQLESEKTYVYPDVVVSCNEEDKDPYRVQYPKIIMEVLSPSTLDYDKGTKLGKYMSVPSIEQVIFISQDQIRVEVFNKKSATFFEVPIFLELDEEVELSGMELSLSLNDIYRGIEI